MGIGSKIIHLESVDSTNNYIANLHNKGEIDSGAVILADNQFAGKGQRGAVWSAKPGENLTFSFFLNDVNLSVESQFVLTQLVSLALIDVLSKFGVNAEVKWPNDIYVGDTKVAGVLIENQLSGGSIKSAIVGVGLNVNQLEFGELNATSLSKETGIHHDIKEVLFSFIGSFNSMTTVYPFTNSEKLKKVYLSKLKGFQKKANYEDADGQFIGKIIDVKSNGYIEIDRGGESIKSYELKELRFIL